MARALAQEPQLLVLDEVTAFLDLPRRVDIMRTLRRLAHDNGATILLSTHDLDLAIHLDPGVVVRYDERLLVGISARPFSTWRGFGRRLRWAFGTLRMHLPEETPWRRRAARRRWQEEHTEEAPGAIA